MRLHDNLDVPLTFEGTRAIGATLGSGVVMIFDETVDLADILTRVAAFFRDEIWPVRVVGERGERLVTDDETVRATTTGSL